MTKKKETISYVPSQPIPPGETLREVLNERGMSQTELADRIGRSTKTVNEIVTGKVSLTPKTALQLEKALGISANFWNNLEMKYKTLLARKKQDEEYEQQKEYLEKYPYEEMVKNGWINSSNGSNSKKVRNLLEFFGVTSFENIIEQKELNRAFRISKNQKYSLPAITSWLRKGVIDSRKIDVDEFNKKKIKKDINHLRKLTKGDSEPDVLMKEIENFFASHGIAFVLTRTLKNAPVHGASRWLDSNKALIQMSLRYSWMDIFWFSLFHELGHILFDKKSSFNVDLKNGESDPEKEERANKFAQDTLILSKDYKKFRSFIEDKLKDSNYKDLYGELVRSIKQFAYQIDTHPGIVVGRLQHDGIIKHNQLNKVRVRFKWED